MNRFYLKSVNVTYCQRLEGASQGIAGRPLPDDLFGVSQV